LSIASAEERLLPYVRKILKDMTPVEALVRDSPGVYLDSASEGGTSNGDSECEEDLGLQSICGVLQAGVWQGMRCAAGAWDKAVPLRLDMTFDLRYSKVRRGSKIIGSIVRRKGVWHLTGRLGTFVFAGRLVRGAACVCLQGLCFVSPAGPPCPGRRAEGRARILAEADVFCAFPPKPWRVELARWAHFPLPDRAMGLAPEPRAVALSWSGEATDALTILGRAAAWNGSPEAELMLCGRIVVVPEALVAALPRTGAAALARDLGLEDGCIVVAPDLVQMRGAFESFIDALTVVGCAVLVIMQAGGHRPRFPRPAPAREGHAGLAAAAPASAPPAFTVGAAPLDAALPALVGRCVHLHVAPACGTTMPRGLGGESGTPLGGLEEELLAAIEAEQEE